MSEDKTGARRVTVAEALGRLPGPGGERFVIEVNAVPGWKALAPTCGVDVAREVLRFLVREGG